MLTKLRCTNFKAWRDSGEMRLAPLTVLFGTNSAGKSSIPQLLLLLQQTAASPDRQRPLHLGDARTAVDLGTYADVVYGHDTDRPVSIALEWSLGALLEAADPISGQRFSGDTLRFDCELGANGARQPVVRSFEYQLQRGDETSLDVGMRARPTAETKKKLEFDLVSTRYPLKRQAGRAWPLPPPVRFYGFPDEAIAYFQNTAFTADIVLEMERVLKSLYYVGPLREYPKRLYLWSGEIPDHVGLKGERAIEAILAAGDRRFNWRPKAKTKTLPELVAERLRDMDLIRHFEVQPLGKNRKEYEVLVQTGSRMPEVKLTDVGFGVSQVLPVIVECFYVPAGSIVIFEQPEIHLHPRVQADLADVFVDAIRAREDGAARHCQFIIESHSEHFLRRLQRRIAEKDIGPDEAALYFVRSGATGAHLEALDVDEYGNIRNWPEGFFGDEMEDLVARAEAQAQRSRGHE
jgi:predicted ATPase